MRAPHAFLCFNALFLKLGSSPCVVFFPLRVSPRARSAGNLGRSFFPSWPHRICNVHTDPWGVLTVRQKPLVRWFLDEHPGPQHRYPRGGRNNPQFPDFAVPCFEVHSGAGWSVLFVRARPPFTHPPARHLGGPEGPPLDGCAPFNQRKMSTCKAHVPRSTKTRRQPLAKINCPGPF